MMTPERRAEIEKMGFGSGTFGFTRAQAITECLAEIDRLNKAVDQAIYRLGPTALDMGVSDLEDVPELAAELERRSKTEDGIPKWDRELLAHVEALPDRDVTE